MSLTVIAIRELHRIHKQLTDLRDRRDRGPKQIKARQVGVTNLEAEHAKAKEAVKTARMAADRKQLELKTGESKILDLQTKLNTCSTNKEYQALLDQIAAAKMANSVLSDEILEGFEKVDELGKKITEAEQRLAAGKEELTKIEQAAAATIATVTVEITRLEVELKDAEASLPAEFRAEYDRLVKAKGEDALAQVEDDCCGGCCQRITSNHQNDLYMGRVVACKSCGRLLYLPEGRVRAGGRG